MLSAAGMTPEQYRRACEISDEVAAIDPAARDAYLESVCADDPTVRKQVLRILAAEHRIPESFLEPGALKEAAKALAFEMSPKMEGVTVGNYRIEGQIGAGGMGTVYEALDLRLNRRVAIKILQSSSLHEPEHVSRFRQEVRAISLLNHPNIVSIYDADAFEGRHYIATEFVEGKTLRWMLAGGAIDLHTIVDIGVQIASALAAAHEAGVVHRDIKPENVMVRPDGIVKVLDFGLAKLTQSAAAPEQFVTRAGQIMGTIHYSSPEQVLGRTVGPRSDLFSLGVVLYEMAAGARPFEGATDGAIFNAIANDAVVPPSQLRPSVPPALDSLILRTLEKDPELRIQTAADLRSSIRYISRPTAPAMVSTRPSRGWLYKAAGLVTVAFLAGLLWRQFEVARTGPLPVSFTQLTDEQGEELFPNISPDGKQVYYADDSRGSWDIHVRRVGGAKATNLTADSQADDTQPSLSPDGSLIAFRSERGGGGIFVMEATGENPHRVTERGYFPCWSPKGDQIAYSDQTFVYPGERGPMSRLYVVTLATGATRQLQTGDAVQPNWSPHGHRIAYWALAAGGQRDLYTVRADGSGQPVAVTNDPAMDWNPVWSAEGDELYFISDRGGTMNVWRVRVDEESGAVRGTPEPVTLPASYVRHLSFGAGGRAMAYAVSQSRVRLFAIGFDPASREATGIMEPIAEGVSGINNFGFSPDGKQLTHDSIGDRQEDIWIMNADGSGRRKLTDDPHKDRAPAWSPDGREILFFSDRSGRYEVWTIRTDGSGLRQRTSLAWPSVQTAIWNDDGSRILVNTSPAAPGFIDSRSTSPQTRLQLLPGLNEFSELLFRAWPRSGDVLLGTTGESRDFVAYSLSRGTAERLNLAGGARPVWLPGSQQFLFARGGRCLLFDMAKRTERELFSVAPNRIFAIGPTPDGRRIYFSQMTRDADLWLGRLVPE